MKVFTPVIIALLVTASSSLASNSKTCATPAIKQSTRTNETLCICRLKAADKHLAPGDKDYLIQYWSGQRNDQPHIYLGNAYPSGKNKPLIKYNAYIAKKCG
jgi:hypothetical protein